MLIDASTFPFGHQIQADVMVIGSGPAGLALALNLASSNCSVVVLESGGVKREIDCDELNEGESVRPDVHAIPSLYRTRVLGGTSAVWGGRCVPLQDIDFEKRDWVPHSGWPIAADEISPWLGPAANFLEAGQAEFEQTTLRTDIELIRGFKSADIAIAVERFSPPTNVGRKYYKDVCRASGLTVVTHATCLELIPNTDNNSISSLRCCGPDGRIFSAQGRFYVAAAGGLETTRLLLASTANNLSGVGNKHGLVGRYYMCHIEGTFGQLELWPANRPVHWGFERTIDGIYARRKLQLTADVQRKERVCNSMWRLHHPIPGNPSHGLAVLSLMYLVKQFIIPEYRRKLGMVDRAQLAHSKRGPNHYIAHLRNLVSDLPGLSSFTANWIIHRYLKYRRIPFVVLPSREGKYPLDFNAEQTPNWHSRVYLGKERDRFGVPRLIVDWQMADDDIKSAVKAFAILKSSFEQSGVGTVNYDPATFIDVVREAVPLGGHHIGTARMATDPKQGVVDGNCKVHGMNNLYIAGSAVFPTSGHANPTLTIVALAMRLAAHIRSLRVDRKIEDFEVSLR